MNIRNLHPWDVSPTEARNLQKQWASQVQLKSLFHEPKTVAGIDCSFSTNGQRIFACIIVLQWPSLKILETAHTCLPVHFPYIPGLLSFREAPACIEAAKKLTLCPDLIMVDGQGIAHPLSLGLASHLGLFLDTPTIGCAKKRLTGKYQEPDINKGSFSWLYNTGNSKTSSPERIIGAVVRTRTQVKSLFVSPGHLCTHTEAVEWVLKCTTKYRLPEPTRKAHQYVTKVKTQ